jgi:uncharacterized protein YqeY
LTVTLANFTRNKEEAQVNNSQMPVIERLKADLRGAMKARDSARVMTLRTMVAALDNATAVEVDSSYVPLAGRTPDVPRRELGEEQQLDILRAEAAGRRKAVEQYERLGQQEEAARVRAELAVFAAYVDFAGSDM